MKKLLVLLVLCTLLFSSACASDIDLSGLSFDELIALKQKINLAIWNCEEWQEVTVPGGIYEIGKDIPAGYWTITPKDAITSFWYGDKLNESKTDAGMGWDYVNGIAITLNGRINNDGTWKYSDNQHQISIDMKEKMYVKFSCDMIFTTYTGTPDLGFK